MARITYLFCIFATLLMAPVSAQDFREGLRAFQSGENERAAAIFRDLAGQNSRDAQFMMGVLHEGGYGVDKNLVEAATWYIKAAEAGLSSAQFNLGIFYQFGHGVRKSAAQAFAWHSRAGRQGHASALPNRLERPQQKPSPRPFRNAKKALSVAETSVTPSKSGMNDIDSEHS